MYFCYTNLIIKSVGNKLKTETMKNIIIVILLFITSLSFGQTIQGVRINNKSNYSENSEIKVVYNDNSNELHPEKKPVGIFVNGTFIGKQPILNTINSEKIESLKVKKENFKKNGKEYYGKILVEMKSEYVPKFLTLKELITKYLDLNTNPIVFQINEKVINQDYNKYLVDEKFILKIVLTKIKTSEKDTEINLIKLITKTTENIKKANEIRIKGTEI